MTRAPMTCRMLTDEEFDAAQDVATSPDHLPTIGDVVARRFGRRDMLRGMLATTAMAGLAPALAPFTAGPAAAAETTDRFGFAEVARGVDTTHHVAAGHDAAVLIRWGDPLFADSPDFDPYAQSAASQLRQFGYNNDFLGFAPLPMGSGTADRGLLCVNHEYTNTDVMIPGLTNGPEKRIVPDRYTREVAEIEMAAHGASIVEVARRPDGSWTYLRESPYNRRINALDTAMDIVGPAAGHPRMRTKDDPDGRRVVGMVNNCAGGMTPWGTYLTCEENFDGYFIGDLAESHPEYVNYSRYEVPGNRYRWGWFHDRFDIVKEPREANRFGWVVEIDPYDPTSTPRKQTALGRFKHEGCGCIVNKDGRVAVYMGDDQQFEFVYRFVTAGTFNPGDRAANMRLLEAGTLSVARFDADGTVAWLPLVHGQGPLTAENGFADQGDVVIDVRRAATLLGATRMDRPEDVEVNPATQKVYALLTNNSNRDAADAANPRTANLWGHIVEMTPPDGDHTAASYRWEILVRAGNPADPAVNASYNPATTENGWFACPDNCAIDHGGRLWIATDQGNNWPKVSGMADGLWSLETEGPLRGTAKRFFRTPIGAELCGPCFTPDDRALFVAVQHPGTDGVAGFVKEGTRASFEDPGTRWPDFDDRVPPRPSVVVVTRKDGGIVGT